MKTFTRPKISIIVPIYNVEKYIERCLNSLINQTLNNIEIILVDDGSPDNCPLLCDKFAQLDNRIKVIHKSNEGLGYARNSGLEIATGEYIGFVDSDDYIEHNMYEILLSKIESTSSDAIFCNCKENYGNEHFNINLDFNQETTFKDEQILSILLDTISSAPKIKKERIFTFSVWKGIFKTDLIRNSNIKFVSERIYLSEDIVFLTDYFKKSNKITFIPDILYIYTTNNFASLTKQIKWSKIEAAVNLYKLLNEKLNNSFEAKERTARLLIGNFRTFSYQIIKSNSSRKDKKIFLSKLNNHEIWKEIDFYNPLNLPLYNSIVLYLQKKKMTNALMTYLSILNKIRNYK